MNSISTLFRRIFRLVLTALLIITLSLMSASALSGQDANHQTQTRQAEPGARLIGRAVLDAATFSPGPTSGAQLGGAPINGQAVPFLDKQPVQGFSAVLENGAGTYLVMSDNGFGNLENSADYHLRVYTIRPNFKTRTSGVGNISVVSFIELHDPDKRIPFTITNHFTKDRALTGADFDIESMQRAADGTLWFGDEFGPFLLHTDARGRALEPPIGLPDFDSPNVQREIRSPQNLFNEESSAVRLMNAVRKHAQSQGGIKTPVFSPWHVMLDDANPDTFIDNRKEPPVGSGLKPASSEIFNVGSIQRAGYPVVVWTVNDKPRMLELMRLGVNGIISDRPDLLRQAVEEFDANRDGTPGDFINSDGLIDIGKFDAQGHRGGRVLRPENTLPAMEVALDSLMSTLELDTGITSDRVAILDHDPLVQAEKCRRADGASYTEANEVLVRDMTAAQLQSTFVCDKVFRGPQQTNDPALSPVSVAFATSRELISPYVIPTLQQVFNFVRFYADYYRFGPGSSHPDAARRWRNAEKVRFNIETKINPRQEFADRTIGPRPFARIVARTVTVNGLENRADIQSFDFRALLEVQKRFQQIRTVYLFGDFPIFADRALPGSDDGTNLQDEKGRNTPWLAGMFWPYRVTSLDNPLRSQTSGGFEGMALSRNGKKLLPLLERPMTGGEANTLLIHEFDLASRKYTGGRYKYRLDSRGTNIGDFIMFTQRNGLVIERDGTQGNLNGFKAIYQIRLPERFGEAVGKTLLVDLLRINDPFRISGTGLPGDVGLGEIFAFPFTTIEDVLVLAPWHIGVLNDNNFPFSVGRHVGAGRPDDNEFIIIRLERPLN